MPFPPRRLPSLPRRSPVRRVTAGCARQGRCQCYSGLLGALTGIASLGGLIVYALQLASSASNGGGGRTLDTELRGVLGPLLRLARHTAAQRDADSESNDNRTDDYGIAPPAEIGEPIEEE